MVRGECCPERPLPSAAAPGPDKDNATAITSKFQGRVSDVNLHRLDNGRVYDIEVEDQRHSIDECVGVTLPIDIESRLTAGKAKESSLAIIMGRGFQECSWRRAIEANHSFANAEVVHLAPTDIVK